MIHPGSVVNKPTTKAYRDGWERTFGKRSAAAKSRRVFEKHLRDHRKALERAGDLALRNLRAP